MAITHSLWTALALVLVIEGLLPFAAPTIWREAFRRMTALSDGQLRFIGLASIVVGILSLLVVIHA
ncbi:MAG TPA: DUF2065 domain-containing protein [Casimicrobiaceae bacterium]|jgi:hypothetical protein